MVERQDDDWRPVDRGQVSTEAHEGPDGVIDRLINLGSGAKQAWPGVSTVGIGVPGMYDPATGVVRFLVNLPGPWPGTPLAGLVSAGLGVPAQLVNDARAFGLAELRLGAGRGASSMVGLVLGTGVGGVIAIDGRVHQGHNGTAGELGHQTIDPGGPSCNCGNNGCLEAFVRADRIARACGTDTAEEAEERARAGDTQALEGMKQVGRYLGIGIGNAIVAFTPDRVVIGGGVAGALDLLLPTIWDELRRRVHMTSLDEVRIVPAQLGPWAGAIGAAVYAAEMADL